MVEEKEEEKGVARRRVVLVKTKREARPPNGWTSVRCNRETILDSVGAETRAWKPLGAPWRLQCDLAGLAGRLGRQNAQAKGEGGLDFGRDGGY